MAEAATNEAIEQSTKEAIEQSTKEEIEQSTKEAIEQSTREAIEQSTKEAVEQSTKEAVEQSTKESVGASAKKVAISGFNLCKKNPKTCGSLIAGTGVGLWVKHKYTQLAKEEKECTALCLPSNWDKYKSGAETELKFRSIPIKDAEGKDIGFPADSICKSSSGNCENFCESKCHKDKGIGAIFGGGILGDTFKELKDLFSGTMKYIFIGIAVVILVMIVFSLVRK